MKNIKVTIMIPTYNQASIVSKAIESCLNQTYENIEIIVADDCSTDNTSEIASKYLSDNRLKYHCNEKNLGRVGNYRNTLYNLASGDYVLNLDGDDRLVDANYISDAVQLINKNPEIVLVFARIEINYLSQNKKVISYKFKNASEIMDGKWFFMNYLNSDAINHTTAVYKRETAIKAGFYQTNILWADWESLSKIVLHGKVGFVDKVAAVWNINDSSASNSIHKESENFTNNLQMIYNPYNYALDQNFFSLKELNIWKYKNIYHYVLVIIGRLCLNKDFKQIKSHLINLQKFEPKIVRRLKFDIRLYIMFFIGNTFIESILRKIFYKIKGAQ